ncbi:hypothetical protein [Pyxidicoccus parkwayensis]|uniref:hypothetical protein n=1 Tax=Pyxidicoccus parkwayensis TaxID=2813578 RepID=UPI001F50694E|nr:hypothetical protein [Pyxidicoccus parkwaysis]
MKKGRHMRRLGLQLRWAGLSVAVLAAPGAFAEDCPQPALDQCANVDYRASACGKTYDAYCQGLVESEWKARWEAAPKRVAVLPNEMGGATATVAYESYRPTKSTLFKGMDHALAGQVLKGQVLYRKGLKDLTDDEQAYLKQLTEWDANGTQLTSCQEYVHEKYYDFSRFELSAGQYGDDYRAAFTGAYGKEGIAYRTLYSRDQAKLAPIWDGKPVAKNAYFLFTPGLYPAGTKAYVFTSEAAKLANNATARQWATPSDSWHESVAKQLANSPDDLLNQRQEEQESFAALLNQRAAVYNEWYQNAKLFKSRDYDTAELDKRAAEQLYALDKSIETSLVSAQKQGCLDSQKLTTCDWSPRRYAKMVQEAMGPRREADLQACLFLTANDFSKTSFVRNADQLKVKGLDLKDYTLSASLLAKYLDIYGQFIRTLDAPTDPSTATVRHGGESSDSGYSGDDTFGGGYDYTAGWEVTEATTAGALGRWCDSNARLYGEFNAYVNVFSPTRAEVAHVNGEAATEGNGIRLKLGARILGLSVYTHDQNYPLRVTFAEGRPFFQSDAARASTTFMVWFIPVTVTGGITAEAGVRMSIGGAITRDCTADLLGLDLFGTITPYASVGGFASVGVGVPGLQVAVRGTLVIARVNVPLYGDIGIYLSSPSHPTDPNTLFLRLSSRLDIEMRFLDGRISLYGELGPLHGEFPIFSWSGFGGRVNLYNESKTVPLARLF